MNAHTHTCTRTVTNIGFLQLPDERQPGLGSSPQLLSILENAPHSFMLTAVYILSKKKKKVEKKKEN